VGRFAAEPFGGWFAGECKRTKDVGARAAPRNGKVRLTTQPVVPWGHHKSDNLFIGAAGNPFDIVLGKSARDGRVDSACAATVSVRGGGTHRPRFSLTPRFRESLAANRPGKQENSLPAEAAPGHGTAPGRIACGSGSLRRRDGSGGPGWRWSPRSSRWGRRRRRRRPGDDPNGSTESLAGSGERCR